MSARKGITELEPIVSHNVDLTKYGLLTDVFVLQGHQHMETIVEFVHKTPNQTQIRHLVFVTGQLRFIYLMRTYVSNVLLNQSPILTKLPVYVSLSTF